MLQQRSRHTEGSLADVSAVVLWTLLLGTPLCSNPTPPPALVRTAPAHGEDGPLHFLSRPAFISEQGPACPFFVCLFVFPLQSDSYNQVLTNDCPAQ